MNGRSSTRFLVPGNFPMARNDERQAPARRFSRELRFLRRLPRIRAAQLAVAAKKFTAEVDSARGCEGYDGSGAGGVDAS